MKGRVSVISEDNVISEVNVRASRSMSQAWEGERRGELLDSAFFFFLYLSTHRPLLIFI